MRLRLGGNYFKIIIRTAALLLYYQVSVKNIKSRPSTERPATRSGMDLDLQIMAEIFNGNLYRPVNNDQFGLQEVVCRDVLCWREKGVPWAQFCF